MLTYREVFDVLTAVVLVDRVCDPDDDVAVTSVGQDPDARLRGGRPHQAEQDRDRVARRHLALTPFVVDHRHDVTAIDDCLLLISSISTKSLRRQTSNILESSFDNRGLSLTCLAKIITKLKAPLKKSKNREILRADVFQQRAGVHGVPGTGGLRWNVETCLVPC